MTYEEYLQKNKKITEKAHTFINSKVYKQAQEFMQTPQYKQAIEYLQKIDKEVHKDIFIKIDELQKN
jgi:outer membrane protein assembly factor BamD (BamD/ComL family)